IGSGTTASPLRRSAVALVRTGPIASTMRPPARPPTAAAPAPAKTAIPVSAALPVLLSTRHGIAPVTMTFPGRDSGVARSRKVRGVRSLGRDDAMGPGPLRSPMVVAKEVGTARSTTSVIAPLIHPPSGRVQHLYWRD